MNEFKFFGRANEKPTLMESEKGFKYCNVLIGVERPYKSQHGEEIIDTFKITCFRTLAEDVCEKLKKGKGLIISGRLQQNNFNKKDNEIWYNTELVGERIDYTD